MFEDTLRPPIVKVKKTADAENQKETLRWLAWKCESHTLAPFVGQSHPIKNLKQAQTNGQLAGQSKEILCATKKTESL